MSIKGVIVFILGLFIATAAPAQSDPCDAVLANGTMSKTTIENNSYARAVFQARYASETYDEAKNDSSLNALLPIHGVPLKLGFSAEDWHKFQTKTRQSIDVNNVNSNSTTIMRTFGDKVIVSGWLSCISGPGFHMRIVSGPSDASAVLEMKYIPIGYGDQFPLIDAVTIDGLTFLGAKPIAGTRIGQSADYPIRLKPGVKGGIIAVNLTNNQSRSVYLVRPIPIPPPPPKIVCSAIPAPDDPGYPYSILDADLNQDTCADHIRLVGNSGSEFMRLTSGEQSHVEKTLYVGDGGYPDYMWWVANLRGDGKWAFCDVVGNSPDYIMQCRVLNKSGTWDGPVIDLGHIDRGYEHTGAWQDLNGDGKKDFCRGVGNNPQDKRACSYFDGTKFTSTSVN